MTTASPLARRMQPCLGTYVEVACRAPAAADALAATEAAFAAVRQAQARWSFHDAASELSCLNAAPGRRVPVSRATVRLLALARALMRASGGAFDVTLGGLLVAEGRLPDHGGPAAQPRGQADDIELGAGWARLRRPVRLTLDGVAKGLAVDLAIGALRRAGASTGWVNAGGDLRVFGDTVLPLQLRGADGVPRAAGGLQDAACASSAVGAGDVAFPGHIVGTSAQPAVPGRWSVLARHAWRADALTKVAACTPAAQRAQAVQRLGGRLLERGA